VRRRILWALVGNHSHTNWDGWQVAWRQGRICCLKLYCCARKNSLWLLSFLVAIRRCSQASWVFMSFTWAAPVLTHSGLFTGFSLL